MKDGIAAEENDLAEADNLGEEGSADWPSDEHSSTEEDCSGDISIRSTHSRSWKLM